jgi:molecular chaperone GrpE
MSHRYPHKNEPPEGGKPPFDGPETIPIEKKTPLPPENTDQLRAELEQAKDRTLRCQAELDNYRKRAAREMDEHRRYASLPLMRDMLPVMDNIQRAIEAAEKSTDGSGLLDGVKLVAQQLEGVLECHHCVKIKALGEPFDPNLHHAILQQPSDDYPPNTVIMVTQDGYLLHDRVVRPSQVIVSANSVDKGQEIRD